MVLPTPHGPPPPEQCPGALSWDEATAHFDFTSDACGVYLEGATLRLRIKRGGVTTTLSAVDYPERNLVETASGTRWTLAGRADAPNVVVDIAQSDAADIAVFEVSLSHPAATGYAWQVEWVELVDARDHGLTLPELTGRASWIQNGYDSWSFTGVESLSNVLGEPARQNGTVAPCANNYDYFSTCSGFSWWFGGVGNDNRTPGLLWGALTAKHWKTFAAGWYPRDRRDRVKFAIVQGTPGDARVLAPGQTLELDPLWLMLAARPPYDLREYAAAVAERTPPRQPAQDSPFGWGTWYYYFKDIDAPTVLANCRELARLIPDESNLLCQIDDNYQTHVGDWTSYNDTFPDGMAALADNIDALGLRPGIWMAPLMADPASDLFKQHPEWFLRDGNGEFVWFDDLLNTTDFAVLDITQPGAAEFLRDAVATKVDEGYSYLKLDFLFTGAYEGARQGGLTSMEAYHEAMRTITEAVGEDVYLLASGQPWLPSVGYFNAARGSSDVTGSVPGFPLYTVTANLGRYHGVRAFVDEIWFSYDPDNLLVRSPLTDSQAEVSAVMTWMSGKTIIGDSLTEATASDLDRLAQATDPALRAWGGRFWAVDLLAETVCWPIATPAFDLAMLANAPPRLWVRQSGDEWLLAAFAWGVTGEYLRFSDHELAADFSGGVSIRQIYGAEEATLKYDGAGGWTTTVPGQSVGVWSLTPSDATGD